MIPSNFRNHLTFSPTLDSLPRGEISVVNCLDPQQFFNPKAVDIYLSFRGTPFMKAEPSENFLIWTEILDAGEDREPLTFVSISTDLDLLNELSWLMESRYSSNVDGHQIEKMIAEECENLRDFLLDNPTLDPKRIFSAQDPIEQINIQIDDPENTEKEILGCLILKQVAQKLKKSNETRDSLSRILIVIQNRVIQNRK